jgi:hypothetical protein
MLTLVYRTQIKNKRETEPVKEWAKMTPMANGTPPSSVSYDITAQATNMKETSTDRPESSYFKKKSGAITTAPFKIDPIWQYRWVRIN